MVYGWRSELFLRYKLGLGIPPGQKLSLGFQISKLSINKHHIKIRIVPTGLSPPVKYFTDRSKAAPLLWIFYVFCLVFAMPVCVSVYMCLAVTCWERADLLALVRGVLL